MTVVFVIIVVVVVIIIGVACECCSCYERDYLRITCMRRVYIPYIT